ncbi:hypothetical protein ACS0TY_027044 [Phlomoides rotata]
MCICILCGTRFFSLVLLRLLRFNAILTEKKTTVAVKAPAAEKKPKAGKKLPKDSATGEKKKRSKKSVETYKIYIFKVLKQVHPDIGILNGYLMVQGL